MKITELTVENHKRITVARVTPKGNMIVIGGENGEGKSSLIESIEALIRGKRGICADPVHHGADKAVIIGKFDNGLVVSKEIFPDGKIKLVVKGSSGSTPQTLLDSFYNAFTFDPDKFFTMEPQKRLEMLRKLTGVDFTEIDAKRQAVYEARADAGRDVTGRRGQLDSMPEHVGVPDAEVAMGDLVAEMNAAIETNKKKYEADRSVKLGADAIARHKANIEEAKDAIAEWQDRLDIAKSRLAGAEMDARRVASRASKIDPVDTAPIQAKIDNLEAVNRKVRENIAKDALERQFREKKELYESLTVELSTIDQRKKAMLAKAKFPIKGLAFGDSDVMYNGVVFDQASQAEKLRVVIAMNIALRPELRIVCVRTASLLDAKNMQILADLADEFDTQIWAERVGQGKECSVIIEDGHVQGVTQPKKKE